MRHYILLHDNRHQSPENQRLVVLVIVAVGGFLLYWLGGILGNFQQHPAPYRFVSAFYYLTIIVPLKTIPSVWQWFEFLNLTPWRNMNSVIRVVGIIGYTVILLSLYTAWVNLLGRIANKTFDIDDGVSVAFGWFSAPAIFAFLWFIFSNILGWLFA